jgi:hypothetical protein
MRASLIDDRIVQVSESDKIYLVYENGDGDIIGDKGQFATDSRTKSYFNVIVYMLKTAMPQPGNFCRNPKEIAF